MGGVLGTEAHDPELEHWFALPSLRGLFSCRFVSVLLSQPHFCHKVPMVEVRRWEGYWALRPMIQNMRTDLPYELHSLFFMSLCFCPFVPSSLLSRGTHGWGQEMGSDTGSWGPWSRTWMQVCPLSCIVFFSCPFVSVLLSPTSLLSWGTCTCTHGWG